MKRLLNLIVLFFAAGLFVFLEQNDIFAQSDINLWHSFRPEEEKVLSYLIKKYELINGDNSVKIKRIDPDSFTSVIENNYNKDNGPDIFIWAHDRLGDWAEKKITVPIDDFADFKVLSEYIKSSINALTYKNKLYGLPFGVECAALFYNKKYITAPPRSFDEMIKISESFIRSGKERYGLLYPYDDYYFHSVLLSGCGGKTFDLENNYNLDTPEMLKSLETSVELFKRKIIPVVPEGKTLWDYQLSLFNGGKLLFLISGPWIIGSLKNVDWGVAVLPKFDDKNYMSPFLGVKGIFVTGKKRGNSHVKKILKIMEFLTSGESGAIMGKMTGYLPANIYAYNDDVLKDNECALIFRDQAVKSVPMPNIASMSIIWNIMNNKSAVELGILRRCQTGQISPESALKIAKEQFYHSLKKEGK
ncbi:MAG TPA: extracellular solute-binding protein [bacterium]|nr:extracellular solute-binding protein [bacterium]HPN30582.1 extracellular solute-binding protein [bacterium]